MKTARTKITKIIAAISAAAMISAVPCYAADTAIYTAPQIKVDNSMIGQLDINSIITNHIITSQTGNSETDSDADCIISAPEVRIDGLTAGVVNINQILTNIVIKNDINLSGEAIGDYISAILGGSNND